MKVAALILMVLLFIGGLWLIVANAGWLVAGGIFLLFWANNLDFKIKHRVFDNI